MDLDELKKKVLPREVFKPVPGQSYSRLTVDQTASGFDQAQIETLLPRDTDLVAWAAKKAKRALDPDERDSYPLAAAKKAALHLDVPAIIDQAASTAGTVRILPDSHPTSIEVAQVVEDIKEKRPHSDVTIPARVVVSDRIGTMYHPASDSINLQQSQTYFPEAERKAIIAHEIGHQDQTRKQGISKIVFDSQAHADAISPELRRICKEAGLTEKQIDLALPSAWLTAASALGADAEKIKSSSDYIGMLETTLSPLEAAKGKAKRLMSPACQKEVDKVNASLNDGIDAASKAEAARSQGEEFAADKFSADVYGPEPIAKALLKLEGGSLPSAQSHIDDSDSSHPATRRRIEALGCTVQNETHWLNLGDRHQSYETTSVTCPSTPKVGDPNTRER